MEYYWHKSHHISWFFFWVNFINIVNRIKCISKWNLSVLNAIGEEVIIRIRMKAEATGESRIRVRRTTHIWTDGNWTSLSIKFSFYQIWTIPSAHKVMHSIIQWENTNFRLFDSISSFEWTEYYYSDHNTNQTAMQ